MYMIYMCMYDLRVVVTQLTFISCSRKWVDLVVESAIVELPVATSTVKKCALSDHFCF